LGELSASTLQPLGRRPATFVSDGRYGKQRQQRTLTAFLGGSLVYTRMRLTQTLVPSRDPSYTSPKPPEANGSESILRRSGERVYDVGSVALVLHLFLSSRRHFREAALPGSRSSRTYAGLSEEWGRATRRRTSSR